MSVFAVSDLISRLKDSFNDIFEAKGIIFIEKQYPWRQYSLYPSANVGKMRDTDALIFPLPVKGEPYGMQQPGEGRGYEDLQEGDWVVG